MHCPAVFCIGTRVFTGAVRASAGKTDFETFEFCPAFYMFRAIPAHGMPFPAYGDAVIIDGKIIFIDGRPAAFAIKVDERRYAVIAAVFIISHGVLGGSQQELAHVCLRQKLLHGVPVIKEPKGIMSGSRAKERENGHSGRRHVRQC